MRGLLLAQNANPADPFDQIKKRGLELLLAQPAIAISLFFMWLCGMVLTFVLFGNTSSFTKHQSFLGSKFFHLGVGFLGSAAILLVYHGWAHKRFVSSVEDLALSALPSTLILASITFVALVIKALRS